MRGNFLYKKVGERIVLERRNKELSQEELAADAAIDRTYLARIEEGKANPSLRVLNKLAKKLQLRLSDLLKDI